MVLRRRGQEVLHDMPEVGTGEGVVAGRRVAAFAKAAH